MKNLILYGLIAFFITSCNDSQEKNMNKKSWLKNMSSGFVAGILATSAYDYIKIKDINDASISIDYPINVTNNNNERVVLEPGEYDILEKNNNFIKVIGKNNSNNTFIIMKEK